MAQTSIYERGGRFYLSIYDASRRPPRKQLSLYTSDEREAQRRKLDLEDALDAGEWDPWSESVKSFLSGENPADLSCKAALDRFLDAKRAEGCTSNTLRTYEGVLDLFFRRQNLSERAIGAVRRQHTETFIRQRDVSRATQRKRYRFLRAFFNWLIKEEYLSESPLEKVKQPKGGKKLPKALRREELDTLCQEADEWFSRLLRFAVYTGLRPSELGRLRWSHIDFDRNLIYVYEQKNGHESTIPLVDAAREVLNEMDRSEGFIFNREKRQGDRWTEYISKRFLRLRKACDLRDELSMYSTRHATATILCEEGVSPVFVQQMMRHADLSTTMRYVHVANQRVKDEVSGVF